MMNTEYDTQIKLAVIPILKALGVEDSQIEKYKFARSQLVGLAVAEVKILKSRLKIAEKELRQYKLIEEASKQLRMF